MRPQLLNLQALNRLPWVGHPPITARYLARRVWAELTSHNVREAQQEAAVGPETVDPFPLQVDSGPILVEIGEGAWRRLDAPPEVLEQQILRRLAQIQCANSHRFSWASDSPPAVLEIHLSADGPSSSIRITAGSPPNTSLSSSPVVGRMYDENDAVLAEIRPPLTRIPLFDDVGPVEVLCDAHGEVIFTSEDDTILFRELGARDPLTRLRVRGSCVLDLLPRSGEARRVSFRIQPRRPVVATSAGPSRPSTQPSTTPFRGWRLGTHAGSFDLSFGPSGSGSDVEAALEHPTVLRFTSSAAGAEVVLTQGRASLGAKVLTHELAATCKDRDSIYVEGKLKLLLSIGHRSIEVRLADAVRVSIVEEGLEPDGPCCWQLVRVGGLRRLTPDGFVEPVSCPMESAR